MERKRRIKLPTGGMVDAVELGFRVEGEEPWTSYLLDDGTLLRVKLALTNIFRLEGQQDHLGRPVYVFESTNVLSISVPEEDL